MAKKNPFRPFTPNAEMISLLPDITGNEINGHGETKVRRPRLVYWAPDPDEIEFGEVQKWFYKQEPPDPELMRERARRKEILEAPLPALAQKQVMRNPSQWTAALDHFIEKGECERVGVAKMRPEWVYEHQQTDFKNVIMLGVQHNYELLKSAPDQVAGADVTRQYGRAALVAKNVAAWLRKQGWDAEAVTGPMAGKILMIPPALECGFGELGKHGSLINPEFGSGFKKENLELMTSVADVECVRMLAHPLRSRLRNKWFVVNKSGTSISINAFHFSPKPQVVQSVLRCVPGQCLEWVRI